MFLLGGLSQTCSKFVVVKKNFTVSSPKNQVLFDCTVTSLYNEMSIPSELLMV